MSVKTLALATAAVFVALSSPAQADLFDQLNKTMDSIDNAITETENTVNSVRGDDDKDLNNTEPAAGNAPPAQQTQNKAPRAPAAAPQNQTESGPHRRRLQSQ